MPARNSVPHSAVAHRHDPADLVRLFDATFAAENTRLLPHADAWRGAIGFADEPVYVPANSDCPFHRVVFAHGYFASALHEVAHWCLAGTARRQRIDYGYWYEPDDRDAATQAEFERVEARPQAIECAFSRAAGFRFRVSADNLSGIEVDTGAFERKVMHALMVFERDGFPPRARRFLDALAGFYA